MLVASSYIASSHSRHLSWYGRITPASAGMHAGWPRRGGASASAASAAAEGMGLQQALAADVDRYVKLATEADMAPDDILKYVWIDTLKQLRDAKFFLSYTKVPLLMEASGLSPEEFNAAIAGN